MCVATVATLIPLASDADTFTWTGGGADKKWSTAANWDSAQTMTAADTANFQAGALSSGTAVYDSGAFSNITVQSGAWTADVSSASFAGKPITVAGGAAFALAGAGARTNPFSTAKNANAVAGVLDLGGAKQTISTDMGGNGTGFFRSGGEIRNGALTVGTAVTAGLNNTLFTVGPGATVSGPVRFYLNVGASLVVDGGTLASSTTADNHPIGTGSGWADVTVRNGGTFKVSKPVWLGFSARGRLAGDGGTVDLGSSDIYVTVRNNTTGVLALTNSTLTCGCIHFGYGTGFPTPNTQTVILKDSVANLSRFDGIVLASNASLVFDGATLVPKAAAANFLPASDKIPAPALGAGGLTVSNAYDVTVAKGLTGAGGLVKMGDAALTLSGANTFAGGIDVREGTLSLPVGASVADSTALALSGGTTLRVAFAPDGGFVSSNMALALDAAASGRVTVEIDTSAGLPEADKAYTLFASGVDAAALERIAFVPDSVYTAAVTQDGALTLTLPRVPVTHVWTGGGADAKWTTAANWDVESDFGTFDQIVFGGTCGSSVYDCEGGLILGGISVGSGVHAANVAAASFARSPVAVASGATFALEGASGAVNPFSTDAGTNVIAGVLDLGGATQTIETPLVGNGEGTFRDGGEIRNGTVELVSGNWFYLKNTSFTFGEDAEVTSDVRLYLQDGAHLRIDGGTFATTYAANNHVVGAYDGPATLEVANGGRLAASCMLIVGHRVDGFVIGDGGVIDLGDKPIYLSNSDIAQATLALTNATLTCSSISLGYASDRGSAQTVALKDTCVSLSRFEARHVAAESSILFDGATLVPKAAAANFLPAGLPSPVLGAGGLAISNAFDVTAAAGLAGAGGLVKKGEGTLTLSGANTFTGGIDVREGALALAAGASFADATRLALAGGTALKVAFSDGGFATSNVVLALDAGVKIAVEIDTSAAVPEPNRAYTLFASGLDAAALDRLSVDPAFDLAVSENGEITLSLTPVTHVWTGGAGADAKWTTAANWNTDSPIVAFDQMVFSVGGRSVYDCADGLRLGGIAAGFGCHTANVAAASFANVPVTVASGATFALEDAGDVANPFSTAADTNVIAGVLDLGGAAQTINGTYLGNGAGPFRDGGEIRNGTVTVAASGEQRLDGTSFTFGKGAVVTCPLRFYLQKGAQFRIDGCAYTNTWTGNHVIGGNASGGTSTLEVSDGGRLVAPCPWFVGHNGGGALVGDGGAIDVGDNPLYLSNSDKAPATLALTNAALTCSDVCFAYSSTQGAAQTLVFKDTVATLAKFTFNKKTDASSILFDGAVLVPKAASADFLPAGLPPPELGAGGLVVSNAFDVTVAAGMTGAGGLVKAGGAKLTVTGDQSFAGDVVVSNGVFAASVAFAGGLRAASGATIDVADATFGGDVVIEDGVALAATNGVDWAATKSVLVAQTTAGVSYPVRPDIGGRHLFVQAKQGMKRLYYGKQAGTILTLR